MHIYGWFYRQSVRTRNALLFCAVFFFVLVVFLLWHQFRGQPQMHDEAIIAATRPLLRIGTSHPFLEGLVREIGSSFVTTVHIIPSREKINDTKNVCGTMDVFFGMSDVDGWVKDMCDDDHEVAIVFLDTYIQAQERRITGEDQVTSPSAYTTGYFWLSTQGGKSMARAIAQTLSSADSVHKVSYLDNAYMVGHQLDDTYKKMKDRLYDMRNVWLAGWGEGWDAIADEYGGTVKQVVDITYNPSAESEFMQTINSTLKKHTRPILLVDATFLLQAFTEKYPTAARQVVVLDPWGDFSDTWSFTAFVEQNLLRVAQAL